jgi:antitoxin (DNA-binding transcriptional repressor) of toxin-antitoxin stability system
MEIQREVPPADLEHISAANKAEVSAKLNQELIHQLAPGEELIIIENQQPVAKLVHDQPSPTKVARPGPGL